MKLLCLLYLFTFPTVCYAQKKVTVPDEYRKHFDQYGVKGSIVVYDHNNRTTYFYDEPRTRIRFSPASTFKIFNSLVGLETGVIPDTSYVLPWDGVKRGNYPPWNRSNSLKSAFKYSVVWYYQELARQVGETRMRQYVSAEKYGNEDIGDTIDGFWLSDYGGRLRISQVEQVDILRRLHDDKLGFSERTQRLVKGIMLAEENDAYRLYAKTGMCSENDVTYGWYVGWFRADDNTYFFATHIEAADAATILKGARQGITHAVIEHLGLIRKL